MRLSDVNGQIAYDLEQFLNDYGDPCGRSFTFEVTCDAVTYVYADVVGTVHAAVSRRPVDATLSMAVRQISTTPAQPRRRPMRVPEHRRPSARPPPA